MINFSFEKKFLFIWEAGGVEHSKVNKIFGERTSCGTVLMDFAKILSKGENW